MDPASGVADTLAGDFALHMRIEQVREALRQGWRGTDRPTIESFLSGVLEPERSALLAELLAIELDLRTAANETPRVGEYLNHFADDSDRAIVERVFQQFRGFTTPPSPDTVSLPERSKESAAAKAAPSHPVIASYEAVRLLGRGGMGVVYEAVDLRLKRHVALKMILSVDHASTEMLDRFRREAELVARLRHPNIVQIYDFGEAEGRPYLVLELVDGKTLAEVSERQPLSARCAAEVLEAISRAMHHAHGQGIIHRDLKPSNILMARNPTAAVPEGDAGSHPSAVGSTQSGQTSTSDGWIPKITDFGLAKDLLDRTEYSTTGAVLGTPAYMAPEQASGRVHDTRPATDIYALGAILYTLLTGRPPFQGSSPVETLALVVGAEPIPPSQLQPKLARDLETTCLKCLQKQPSRRYATAGEVAEDLRRFLNGETILARPVGPLEKTLRWCRRNPAIASLSAGLLAMLIAGVVISLRFALQAYREADTAKSAQERAETISRYARERAYLSDMRQIQSDWKDNLLDVIRELLDAQLPKSPSEQDLRHFEWYYWHRLVNQTPVVGRHQGHVTCVRITPDGQFFASTGKDSLIRIWKFGQATEYRVLQGHRGMVNEICFSPAGDLLTSAGVDRTVRVWDWQKGVETRKWEEHTESVTGVDWSQDGQWLASSSMDKSVILRSLVDDKRKITIPHSSGVQCVAFTPDQARVALGGEDAVIRVWNIASGQETLRLLGHAGRINALRFSLDGQQLISCANDSTTRIWNALTGHTLQVLDHTRWSDLELSLSPDGRKFVSGNYDRSIKCFNLASGKGELSLKGHSLAVLTVCFHPDGQRVLSGGEDGEIRLWNLEDRASLEVRHRDPHQINSLACSPDGRWLASAGGNLDPVTRERITEVLLWDRQSMEAPRQLEAHNCGANCVVFSPDGKYLAAAGGDWDEQQRQFQKGIIKLWNPENGQWLADLPGHEKRIFTLAISKDSQWIASGGTTGDVLIRRLPNGRDSYAVVCGFKNAITALAFSPDGRRLVIGGFDNAVKVWDLARNQEVASLAYDMPISSVAFRPDGKELAVADYNSELHLYDAELLQETRRFRGHTGGISCLAFSADGRRIVTGSEDSTVKVWDTATGKELLTLTGHSKVVKGIAFSPDARTLYSGSWDKTLRMWKATEVDLDQGGRGAGQGRGQLEEATHRPPAPRGEESRASPQGASGPGGQ